MAAVDNIESKSQRCLGFLTVVECPQDGLFGGYLALDFRGRPLEFRCTAPIKPNRAQQILYGATLRNYLYGEQIGKTLLTGCKNPPFVVCTDRPPVLAVRELVDVPVALVEVPAEPQADADMTPTEDGSLASSPETKAWRLHAAHGSDPPLDHFHLGRNHLATAAHAEADASTITERLAGLADTFDLAEPFVRIREAIDEARRAGGG